ILSGMCPSPKDVLIGGRRDGIKCRSVVGVRVVLALDVFRGAQAPQATRRARAAMFRPMQIDTEITARGARFRLAGSYEPEFRPVVDAFAENFRVEDEVGAACAIMLDGRMVVDVWGGWRDAAMTVPWDAPTMV